MIRFTPEAEADLQDIAKWITKDRGKAVALRIHDRIGANLRHLNQFPLIGRVGRIVGTRELGVVGLPFIAVYEVEPGGVLVLRIIHGAMQWPPEHQDT